jgi:DNA end-binding protein Ku
MWRGSLSFGLVNVPVAVFSAVRDMDVRFNQLDEESGARLRVQRVCKEEDVEIPYEELAHGYPRSDGEGYVMLTDEELAAAQPEKTRTIDIDEFVPLADIDPIYFDHPYFLVPVGEGEGPLRAYKLLVSAMEDCGGRVAIGRFVLRTKEYLVALRVREGLLQDKRKKDHKPDKDELKSAVALIEELSTDWDPKAHEDRHRERLLAIVKKKQKGQTIKAPAEPEVPAAVPDLMAALQESLAAAKKGEKATA